MKFGQEFEKLVTWMKRSAKADGRRMLTLKDMVVAFYALQDDPRLQNSLKGAMKVKNLNEISWPGYAKEMYRKAWEVGEPTEKFQLDQETRNIFNNVPPDQISAEYLAGEVVKKIPDLIIRHRNPQNLARWSPLQGTINKRRTLVNFLKSRVVGQETAVNMLADGYLQMKIDPNANGPMGIFTFTGPPGVGKTLLARTFAQAFNEIEAENYKFKKFDMANYAGPQAHEYLFGIPKFYSNAKPGELTGFVDKNPKTIILFDEIEKAGYEVINALLGVLDTGMGYDNCLDRYIDFHKTILLFTSNLGADYLQDINQTGYLADSSDPSVVFDLLRKGGSALRPSQNTPILTPEFVSRLAKGGGVLFRRLEMIDFLEITRHALNESKLEIPMAVSMTNEAALVFLLSLLPQFDARVVTSQVTMLRSNLAKEVAVDCLDEVSAYDNVEVKVTLSPRARDYLRDRLQHFNVRLLVLDDDEYLPKDIRTTWTARDPAGGSNLFINQINPLNFEDRELLQKVKEFSPDLFLLDLSIGEKQSSDRIDKGLDILERLRRNFRNIPVYLFSESPDMRGYNFNRTVERVMESGGARAFFAFRASQIKQKTIMADSFWEEFISRLESVLYEKLYRDLLRHRKKLSFTRRLVCDNGVSIYLDSPAEFVVKEAEDPYSKEVRFDFVGVPEVTFNDVVGLKRAKGRLKQVVTWLQEPTSLYKLGVTLPRGFLLAGPPGTGKTLLAMAVAGEADLPFFYISPGMLKRKFYGESEALVRQLFANAKKYAPSIIFIDELDTIATSRDTPSVNNEANVSVLNEFLAQLDGFDTKSDRVFVLGATNRPEVIDPALLRPGRFDEVIYVDLPDFDARKELLVRLLQKKMNLPDRELRAIVERLAGMTPGTSPAQLGRIVREAAYRAISQDRSYITEQDLEYARQFVLYGAQKADEALKKEVRTRTAFHEAGHAIVHMALFPHETIDVVTIIPHEGGALGFVGTLEDESRTNMTTEDVIKRMAVLLAGRIGEQLGPGGPEILDSGAANDLERATYLAWLAIAKWGMDREFQDVAITVLPSNVSTQLNGSLIKRIQAWIAQARTLTETFLKRFASQHRKLANALLERGSVSGNQLSTIVSGINTDCRD